MHSIPVHTISAAVLLCFSLSVLPQTMTENHVLTEFFLEPSGVRSVKSADYYDGLGRRVQTVSGGKNACGLYTVAHSVLDSHGLDSVSWLPVAGGSVPDMASAASLSERPYGDGAAYSVTLRDALGRVTSVTRSGGAGAVRYDHDLHGWVTSVEGRGFSETLHYADGLGVPLYNGSVSSRQWQCDGDPYLRGYKYSYDSLGRMTDAVYGQRDDMGKHQNRYNESVLSYTANGAVERLQRRGLKDDGEYGKVDNLNIELDGNRLLRVTDDAFPVTRSGASDFRDGSGEEREYLYDSSGSLTADLNKGISLISYDYLGHPLTVQFTTGSRTDYVYTADGQRLRTVHTTAVDGIAVPLSQTLDLTPSQTLSKDSVDYAGGMVFLNGRPWLRPFSGGYISFDGDISADTVSVSFHYYTCDSQGNICAVVSEDGTVEQVTHYYPFGGTFADAGQNPFLQPYKYAGKELDRMHGLDWYDFGARIYDPVLVQWTSMDPLCEKYYHTSPYAYCGNDPVNAVDPDGRDWISAKYDGELFVYFDSRVSSQDDIRELYYGGGGHESISYVGKSGRITRNDKTLFSLSEDGSFYDASGNKVEKEYSIDGLLHVGSDKLGNDGKYSHNWYGTYLGPNNPTIAIDKHDDDKYSYSIPPIDRLDYAAFLHDKAYDLHNANGIIGAMINTSVVSADAALAFRSFKESLNQSCTSKEFLWSVATGSAFSMISMFKTYIKFRMFGLSFPFK